MSVTINDFHAMVERETRVGHTLGDMATRENTDYKATSASLGKRILFGILTAGLYNLVQLHKDHVHRDEMAKISTGTKNFYTALNTLYTHQSREDGSTWEFQQKPENYKVMLCKDEYVHLSYEDGTYYYQYQSGEKMGTKKALGDPVELLKSIEHDVMAHSEDFDTDFVKEMLDTRINDLGVHARRGLSGQLDEASDAVNEMEGYGIYHALNERSKFQMIATGLNASRTAVATESRKRLETMLNTLFTSRGGLDDGEAAFIDLDLGIKLGKEIVDGNVTAAGIRAFINRNGSATHFTTIECAKLLQNLELAKETESSRYAQNLSNGKVSASTTSITFKNGYYEPKPNPALPTGDDAQIHDFVAKIIYDDNMATQEQGVREGIKTAHERTALLKNPNARPEARLRRLFSENMELIVKLMENAGQVKDGKAPSMLASIEPELRDTLQKNLLELENKYQAKIKQLEESKEYAERTASEYSNSEFAQKKIQEAQDNLKTFSGPEGRKVFLANILMEQRIREDSNNKKLDGAKVDELSASDLDTLGSKMSGAQGEKSGDFRPVYAKMTGRPEKDGPILASEMLDDPARKKELEYGLDFFARLEKDIDEGVSKALVKVQSDIDNQLKDVFNNMGGKDGQMSLADMQHMPLKAIIGDASQNTDMLLIKNALGRYFKEMPAMDQRSMLAAQTRFCTSTSRSGAKLGALLKGAGPVMQKMLQGLDPSLFTNEDFKIALGDMKDKLAPISQEVIQAYLFDVVQQSKGNIKSINVEKSLGAASVAQTLRCKVTYKDGRNETVVFKMLRPDATMRAEREKAVFDNAAKEVGRGMPMTFQSRYDSIMEELDLRNEAKNVSAGFQVYDYNQKDYEHNPKLQQSYGSFANVHSMELFEGIEPSINVLPLKEVKGESLDSYLEDIGKQAQNIVHNSQEQISQSDAPDAKADHALQGAKELGKLYDDCKKKLQALTNLSYMWANEGLFASGFYHGDVHKGNIIVDKGILQKPDEEIGQTGATLIDFGNAVTLDAKGKKQVIQTITGTAVGDFAVFDKGFKAMLSPKSREKYDAAIQNGQLQEKLTYILGLEEGLNGTASRLTAILTFMQREFQIEVPGPIHNFLESQKRLQVCLDETKSTMDAISRDIETLMKDHINDISDEQEKEDIQKRMLEAQAYKPGGMMKAITDVVKQNLFATIKSLGSDSKRCFQKIKGQLDEHGNIIDNDVDAWNNQQFQGKEPEGSKMLRRTDRDEELDLNGLPLNRENIPV